MSQHADPSSQWEPQVLAAFKESLKDGLHPDDTGGKNGQSFARGLEGVDPACLPKAQVKRSEVFSLAEDRSVNTATVCAAAMAWGGMNQRFSPRFFSMAKDGWLDVAEAIQAGELDREAAYDAFSDLRRDGKLYGCRPQVWQL
ncbi:hypothetical protein [Aliiruegeria lutimaris]|uniref:Uncharacterized protein n=1 Tax=Aliiruegeria lutimaris TaxID=571298 RepID=A0A1G9F710_9RHOB|nr:hypothetical protein [Aliiruegeria lutimaris]SDK84184.1 hypothetical protein SAMN04488026_10561 [Aliiruegeria lutimaris]